MEPAAVGTLRSVESFTVGAQFPAGSARVAFAPDGSFVIGFTFVGRTAIRDSALQRSDGHEIGVAKIRSDGTVAWARAFGGPGDDDLLALAVDDAGDVYIAGGFKSASVTFETARARNGSAEASFVAKLAGDSGSAVASVTFDKAASPGGRCTGLAARSGVVAVGCSMDDGKAAVMEGSSSVDVVAPGGSSGIFVAELEPSTLAPTGHAYIHPATHAAGAADASLPPMGLRVRLKASFPETGFGGPSLVVIVGGSVCSGARSDSPSSRPRR